MRFRVYCDFDGTIAREDVTDSLLEAFALPEWREVEAEWKAGRIGSRECMARQVDMIRAPLAAIDAHLDGLEIDPGFPAFAEFCRRERIPLMVVSDGLDYAIRRILGRHGLDHLPMRANAFHVRGDGGAGEGRYQLSFPHASDGCAQSLGTCKCRISAEGAAGGHAGGGNDGSLSILIGDGASDFCAASSVDLVFAKDRLLAHCRQRGLPFIAYRDFTEARQLLSRRLSPQEAGDIHQTALSLETRLDD